MKGSDNMLPSRIFFDDLMDDFHEPSKKTMLCDISLVDNEYHIEVDVPGFNKEDIELQYNDGNLKIIAFKKQEEHSNKKYLHRERKSFEKCERTIYLGKVNEEAIKAEFKNGTLHIVVPKQDEEKSTKKIAID